MKDSTTVTVPRSVLLAAEQVTVPRSVLLAAGRLAIAAGNIFHVQVQSALSEALDAYDHEVLALMDKPVRKEKKGWMSKLPKSPHRLVWGHNSEGICKICGCRSRVAEAGPRKGRTQQWRVKTHGIWRAWTTERPGCSGGTT